MTPAAPASAVRPNRGCSRARHHSNTTRANGSAAGSWDSRYWSRLVSRCDQGKRYFSTCRTASGESQKDQSGSLDANTRVVAVRKPYRHLPNNDRPMQKKTMKRRKPITKSPAITPPSKEPIVHKNGAYKSGGNGGRKGRRFRYSYVSVSATRIRPSNTSWSRGP